MKTIRLKKNIEIGGFDLILYYNQPPFNSNAVQIFNIKTLKRALYLLRRNANNGYEFIY